ncbi:MAG: hypothetical protein QXU54_01495 [Candidatus Micrarchaeia archaeon]
MNGQASLEFMVVLVAYMFILLTYFLAYQGISDSTMDRMAYLYAQTSADMLAAAINGVAAQDASNCTANLSLLRGGITYSLEGRTLRAEFGSAVAYSQLLTDDVKLLFNGTSVRLRKAGGIVYVEDL